MKIKPLLLIISTIIFLALIFFNLSYATLYFIQDQDGNIIMVTDQENLKSKYLESGCTFYTLEESEPPTLEPPADLKPETKELEDKLKKEIEELENQPKPKIKIIDSNNRPSSSGTYQYVEGIIKNVGKVIVSNIKIKVKALDKHGKLVSIDDGYADPSTLAPGQEATYQIMVRSDPNITDFETTVYGD